MARTTDQKRPDLIRSVTDTTPLYAVVGIGDLAVERLRGAVAVAERRQSRIQADVRRMVGELEGKTLPALAGQVPSLLVARLVEAASKAEKEYEDFAERGKSLVQRVRSQQGSRDLAEQGRVTLSRARAAVTTARRSAEHSATAAQEALVTTGHQAAGVVRDTATVATDAVGQVGASARSRARTTSEAAKRAADTTRTRAGATRSAGRAVTTSVRKTAERAGEAAKAAEAKTGDGTATRRRATAADPSTSTPGSPAGTPARTPRATRTATPPSTANGSTAATPRKRATKTTAAKRGQDASGA